MARIDNLNAHTKKTHGGLTWQEAVARVAAAASVAAQQIPTTVVLDGAQVASYELSTATGSSCLELKAVLADCFKNGGVGGGVVLVGSSNGVSEEFKILGSPPPSPSSSWMT